MRNELNKLCKYNKIAGDVNLDGRFSIDDITCMQKNLSDIIQFNSSQKFIAYEDEHYNVDNITLWQKYLANIDDAIFVSMTESLDKLSETYIIDPNEKYQVFNGITEKSNHMYYKDCYYYYPWWITD